MKRRAFLATTALAALAARAQSPTSPRFQPVQDIGPILEKLTHGAKPETGGIKIDWPQIAENGNSVPLHVRVDSPMTAADHVAAIHLIAERNPRPLVGSFFLGPAAGKPELSTRIRLAGTQKLTVLAAMSDGRFRLAQTEVLVTSAACLDESM